MKIFILALGILAVLVGGFFALNSYIYNEKQAEVPPSVESEEQKDEGIIVARIDEGGSALSVKVIPHEVLEDSRCPEGVTCIWEGRVLLRTTLESGLGTSSHVFTLGEPVTTEAEEITLIEVTPYPREGTLIAPSDYRFHFTVKKR